LDKNICVVGCGHWGKNLARNFFELGSLHSICEENQEIATKLKHEFKVENKSFKDALEDPKIAGIVLSVPAPLHAKMAIMAINKNKHVYIEKPLAINLLEAENIVQASKNSNSRIMVGHLLQYHPAFIKLKEIVSNKTLGELKFISSRRMSMGKVRSYEDVIWSFAPHDISMILSLFSDEPESVFVEAQDILQAKIFDIASLNLSFKNNKKATISVSWLHPFKEHQLIVIGSKAIAIFDDTKPNDDKLKIKRFIFNNDSLNPKIEHSDFESIVIDDKEPLKQECIHFQKVVQKSFMPQTDLNEGIKVMKVLTALTESINQRSPIYLTNDINQTN
jgi:UDP-2-acetamido-3-amino-2,3-dideoxy-glucuronate N-acetyltransferase